MEIKPCIKCGAKDRYKSGACRQCAIKRSAIWQKNNKERRRRICKKYRDNHPEAVRESFIKHWNANYEKSKQKAKEWVQNNREKSRKIKADWAKRNPEYVKTRKKLRTHGSIGIVSKGIIEKLYKLQRGKCPCCGLPLGDDYHMDHIMPVKLGGLNVDNNIQLLRAKCNLQKSAKHPIDYMQSKGFLL